MTNIIDNSTFPNETYKETVLAPLFDASKTAFADYHFRVNLAHCVMLTEQGILSKEQASLRAITRASPIPGAAAMILIIPFLRCT